MKKIKSTKAFKDAVDVAFDTQTKRDRKKREYALGHPEVFDPGEDGRSREGSTDRVKYKLTSGEALERIDGGPLSDKAWLNSLPDDYVRQKPELNKLAIKGANLTDGELAEIGLRRAETQTMKFTAAA